jgi:hypothetical protein
MKKIILILFVCLFGHNLFAQEWLKHQIVVGCRVFDLKGAVLKVLPGDYCLFFDDGRLLSRGFYGITMFNKDSQKLWHIDGYFHHQMNFNQDKSQILAIGSALVERNKKKIKIDKLMVISFEGKILHEVTSEDLNQQAKLVENIRDAGSIVLSQMNTGLELTHFNSFYELPKFKKLKLPQYLYDSSFVVNGRGDGVYFLSADLKKLNKHFFLKQAFEHETHDVQLFEDGIMLFYNNLMPGFVRDVKGSAIQEMDLASEKIVFQFTGKPMTLFYSEVSGGVQRLDADHLLFSHLVAGSFIYSRSKKEIVWFSFNTHKHGPSFVAVQQVKSMDLRSFLGHWK